MVERELRDRDDQIAWPLALKLVCAVMECGLIAPTRDEPETRNALVRLCVFRPTFMRALLPPRSYSWDKAKRARHSCQAKMEARAVCDKLLDRLVVMQIWRFWWMVAGERRGRRLGADRGSDGEEARQRCQDGLNLEFNNSNALFVSSRRFVV